MAEGSLNLKLNRKEPKIIPAKFQGKMFLIPSFVTVLGIFAGFLGLISAVKGNFEYAAQCIFVGIVIDGLDGRVARRLNATSDFGREFDSLSDVITFGVTPAALLYFWAFRQLADEFGLLVAFIYVVCGAARLARFNVTSVSKSNFVGLPIPGAAGVIASLVYLSPEQVTTDFVIAALMCFAAILSFLMVSTLPFFSIKYLRVTSNNWRLSISLLAAGVALAWYNIRVVLFAGFVVYILSGPLLSLWEKKKGKAASQ